MSFPVPLSPWISTGKFAWAILSICFRMRSMADEDSPKITLSGGKVSLAGRKVMLRLILWAFSVHLKRQTVLERATATQTLVSPHSFNHLTAHRRWPQFTRVTIIKVENVFT